MTVSVKIPTPLRSLTDGLSEVSIPGQTVQEVISEIGQQYPGLQEKLLDEHGQPRMFVNIYLNDEDIRYLNNLETTLKDGDQLYIIPAIAGG